ncbi:hypothetical protein QVD17_14824 [Tagetes erecta]|uniref:CCHC-type domain-containing protein n=1 Tax=Tagetes erecta TaxID=13708 RepID=A0AAD8KN51_TARER|nr:hypothetical protein QVD17_14824 [Tagetes erecta]
MAGDGNVTIEKFDGKKFGWWKMQIEALLCEKDLDAVLEGVKPEETSQADWKKMDKKARAVITLSLSENVAYNIQKETTASGMMTALSNMYEKPSAANKVYLIRELVNTRMKEGDSVTVHINNLNSILSRLISVNIKFDDEVQALLLLSSLPESWSGTVTAVSNSSDTSKFTFEKIRDLILGEDVRRRGSGESSSSLLSTEGRGRKNKRGSRQGRRRSQSKARKDVICWNCKEAGHFRNQCPNPKKDSNTIEDYADDDALICSVENKALQKLKGGDFGKVRLANDEVLDVTGMGDMDLFTSVGSKWTLKDVRVIPSLKKQLISVGQLDEEGHEVKFRNGQWKVVKGNLVIARGKKRGSLYMVSLLSEGNVIPVQKRNKIRFTESKGQKKVCFADDKPRASGQIQVERIGKGSEKSVRGFRGSGSIGSRPTKASVRITRRWVMRTSIPSVKVSLEDYLFYSESVCSQGVSESGSLSQWEPVETENESEADLAVTDVLEFRGASTGL